MFLYFINNEAKSVKKVTLYYFETNHGQWEGDSIHSAVERAIRKAGELFTPPPPVGNSHQVSQEK